MKIKVCGMRNMENIESLLALNPDYVGFIFYNKSRRYVDDFPKITFPDSVKKIGVFVNETLEEVLKKVSDFGLNGVQLHGNESPQYCEELVRKLKLKSPRESRVVIKAFSVDSLFDFNITNSYEAHCDYLLFDTKGKNYGGNGIKFNWEILKKYHGNTPFLLSGGISKEDVTEIKDFHHIAFGGIDINSGFEIEPGLKNINEIKEFKSNLL
jgi:phosphoribosylanthranilate isomerase